MTKITSTTRSHEAACVPPATPYRLLNPKWPLLESLGGWVGCQPSFLFSYFIFHFLFLVFCISFFVFYFCICFSFFVFHCSFFVCFFVFCFSFFVLCFSLFAFHFLFFVFIFNFSFFVFCFSFFVFHCSIFVFHFSFFVFHFCISFFVFSECGIAQPSSKYQLDLREFIQESLENFSPECGIAQLRPPFIYLF